MYDFLPSRWLHQTSGATATGEFLQDPMIFPEFAEGIEMLFQILEQDIAKREIIWPLEHRSLELLDNFLLPNGRGHLIEMVLPPGQ